MHKLKKLLILLIFLSGCNFNNKDNVIKIALDWAPNPNHIGLFLAQELKYFEDQGITLEFINPTAISVEELVNQNKADYGLSYSENLTLYNQQNDNLVSIYSIYNQNLSGFISKKDKNITSITDFSGKRYCGWGSEAELAILKALLEENGVSPETVEFITTDLRLTTDVENQCDIFWSYANWENVIADLSGVEYNFIPLTDLGLNYYTPIIIANKSNPNPLTKKFIIAANKGYNSVQDNQDLATKILMNLNPAYDQETITQTLNASLPYFNSSGHQESTIWDSFLDFCMSNNIIKHKNKDYTNEYTVGL